MVEGINVSDHFPKIGTYRGGLRHFYLSQKLRAQMLCFEYIHNANTLLLVYLFKNLSLDVFSRNPIIELFLLESIMILFINKMILLGKKNGCKYVENKLPLL